jgi:hypothetical protein
MTVTRVCYCSREDVKAAIDVKASAYSDARIDSACEAAADSIEGLTHRKFYPVTATRYFDWPNYQMAAPWRVWFDEREVADATNAVVKSGTVTIAASSVFFEPVNSGPPFTYMELDRSTSASFGYNKTPQRDISVTTSFGFWTQTTPAGTLTVALSDTTGTSVQVSNGAAVGVGDYILIDTERMIVTDRAMVTTGQSQQGAGAGTASMADVSLGVTDGTKFTPGEVLLLGSERMLVVDVTANTVTVKRGWDGSVLATHSGATIYASRLLTVTRGALGSTAATHLINTAIGRGVVPGLIRRLAVAEAETILLQEVGGYAGVQGSGPAMVSGVGKGVDAIRAQAYSQFGRMGRIGVV